MGVIRSVISPADKSLFEEQGYLLVPNVVPASLCEAVVSCVAAWLAIDPIDPSTWPDPEGHGIVPLHHAQALWQVRQHPQVHEVFATLYAQQALWVSFDRASFKGPGHETNLLAEPIHWDGDPTNLKDDSFQGLVYLRDTGVDQGAFCCVPGIYRDLSSYATNHVEAIRTRKPSGISESEIDVVGGNQGSLLIWNRKLPHSSTVNRSGQPRWVQYVAMDLARSEQARLERIKMFEDRLPPKWAEIQKVPGQQIPEPFEPIELTTLGRKLVGYV
ncbi:MAG: hypothetical protein GKR90_08200 [Pseudomonadales bacterium]|nr:hypothetical protein [Pseudomonadales bacterium]